MRKQGLASSGVVAAGLWAQETAVAVATAANASVNALTLRGRKFVLIETTLAKVTKIVTARGLFDKDLGLAPIALF